MLIYNIIFIILSILPYSIGQVNTRNLPFDIKPELQVLFHLENYYVKIITKDIPGSFDTISGSGFFQCFDFFGNKQILTHFASDLILNEASKEWSSKPVPVPNCSITLFEYSVNAFKQGSNPTSYSFNGIKNISDRLNSQKTPTTINHETNNLNNNNRQTDSNTNKECEKSKTTINLNQNVCKGKLIFEDDFNEMNWTKWERDIKIPLDTEDADFVSFQNFEENLYIKDGILYILPKLLTDLTDHDERSMRMGTLNLGLNCTGIVDRNLECVRNASTFSILPPVVSASIKTKNMFAFKYGVIEIRAKLPKGDWIIPQLFLEPLTNNYGVFGYSSGQIRVAFIRGNEILISKDGKRFDGYRLYGGVVLAQGEKFRELWMKNTLQSNHFADDFHVYKTIWTDEFILFEVDGIEYGRLNGDFGFEAFDVNKIKHGESWKISSKIAPFDKEFFLSLGVSVGGISDFPDDTKCGKRDLDIKPWINYDIKNQLNFWRAKELWHSTWIGENAALKVDYVRVWAL